VRDRAALNLRLMQEDDELAERFIKNDSIFLLSTFEHQLVMYVASENKKVFSKAFDLSTIPVVSHEQALAEERTQKLHTATPTLKAPSTGPSKSQTNGAAERGASAAANTQKYQEAFERIPELRAYGPVLKSSTKVELTESETEYVVTAIKHIFTNHIVLQYDITNTLPNTVLEDVSVIATPAEEEEGQGDDQPSLEEDFLIPAPKLSTNEPGTLYVAFKKIHHHHPENQPSFPITSFTNTLKFTSKEIDPSTGEPDASGYDDEYEVDGLDLSGADYVIPAFAGGFDHVWEGVGARADSEEASETLQLGNVKGLSGISPISFSAMSSILIPRAPPAPFIPLSNSLTSIPTQTPPTNSPRRSPCNRSKAPTSPSPPAPTPSSSTATPSPAAASPPSSRWPTRPSPASRSRWR
jgi:coatomer subunit gamma